MNKGCTVYKTMDYLSKKWTVMIILELYKGNRWKRFSEIKRSMEEITPKMLSERLRALEGEGIVERRTDDSEVPTKVFYRLTEMGLDLIPIIKDVKSWALKWKEKNVACASQDCIACVL
ncbi:MAG: helix-turn-helix domain-containing protein [Candidatus Methanomethylophilaceae archaeon]|nr:helix-turn-helix domain-containing protein [Candidatus Methanomethylophilaceae archaeon]MDD4119823.1 helix-turn-helix domain-containing protein [Candidatus Methanomethylophilaceae archaeon]